VNASQSTLAKLACRWAMHAGSCIAWSMASSLTVRCPRTRRLGTGTIPSTPSSARRAPGSMCHALSLSTSNLPLS
ncbi:hypothetical protein BaRGS_00002272, partial [Batillaria attramentaria]